MNLFTTAPRPDSRPDSRQSIAPAGHNAARDARTRRPARSVAQPPDRERVAPVRAPAETGPATDAPLRSDRSQVVAEILELNHTVTAAWLEQFDDRGLSDYLRRLRELASPESTGLRPWVRTGGQPAVIGRVVRA